MVHHAASQPPSASVTAASSGGPSTAPSAAPCATKPPAIATCVWLGAWAMPPSKQTAGNGPLTRAKQTASGILASTGVKGAYSVAAQTPMPVKVSPRSSQRATPRCRSQALVMEPTVVARTKSAVKSAAASTERSCVSIRKVGSHAISACHCTANIAKAAPKSQGPGRASVARTPAPSNVPPAAGIRQRPGAATQAKAARKSRISPALMNQRPRQPTDSSSTVAITSENAIPTGM